jgi:hypothetical protein
MKLIVKILYKPFGIVFGLFGGYAARQLFNALWSKVDKEEPPKATTDGVSWGKVVGAAAFQAATFAATRAAADRAGAETFRHLFGAWPGDRRDDRS